VGWEMCIRDWMMMAGTMTSVMMMMRRRSGR
jgi:hypothetical protein